MCCTHPCDDLNKFTTFKNHQTSKERIHETQEQKVCKNNDYQLYLSRYCNKILSNSTRFG